MCSRWLWAISSMRPIRFRSRRSSIGATERMPSSTAGAGTEVVTPVSPTEGSGAGASRALTAGRAAHDRELSGDWVFNGD